MWCGHRARQSRGACGFIRADEGCAHCQGSSASCLLSAVGGILGIVGFFVIPVIGLFIGFVVGAMLAELIRTHSVRAAWRGTVSASKAAVITMGIELFAALLGTAIWLVGAGIW